MLNIEKWKLVLKCVSIKLVWKQFLLEKSFGMILQDGSYSEKKKRRRIFLCHQRLSYIWNRYDGWWRDDNVWDGSESKSSRIDHFDLDWPDANALAWSSLLKILQVKEDFVSERQIVSCFWLLFSLHFYVLFGLRSLTSKSMIFHWIGNRFIRSVSVMDKGLF